MLKSNLILCYETKQQNSYPSILKPFLQNYCIQVQKRFTSCLMTKFVSKMMELQWVLIGTFIYKYICDVIRRTSRTNANILYLLDKICLSTHVYVNREKVDLVLIKLNSFHLNISLNHKRKIKQRFRYTCKKIKD